MELLSLWQSLTYPQRMAKALAISPGIQCAIIMLLLCLGAGIVYATGGTAYAYPYLMLIPILIAASWYALLAT